MKPDYKNWVPKSMVTGLFSGAAAAFGLFLAFGATGLILRGRPRLICAWILGAGIALVLSSGFLPFLRDYTMIIVAVMFLAAGIAACLADGYSITDVVELLQQSGIDGTDRQLRYALDRAGIHRRQTKRARTGTNRRQAGQTMPDSGTAESGINVQEDSQPGASEDVHAVQNSNERSSGDPQTPSSADSGYAQSNGAFGPAETQPAPRAGRQAGQVSSSSSPAVPQTPSRTAMNDTQSERELTPEEKAELDAFDRAGADDF